LRSEPPVQSVISFKRSGATGVRRDLKTEKPRDISCYVCGTLVRKNFLCGATQRHTCMAHLGQGGV
jgi:hypothetical protein